MVTQRGCATPDHVIRTKPWPLVVDTAGDIDRATLEEALCAYAGRYHERFVRCSEARRVTPRELDGWPRVLLFPGLGMMTVGATHAEAEIAADIYEHTMAVIDDAEALGGYKPTSELDLFDVEYWSLEQAKLKKSGAAGPLERRVALVTGSASGIGLATARALLAGGAHVMITDRDAKTLDVALADLGRRFGTRVASMICDVTSEVDAQNAVAKAATLFGGLDVLVSNAGAAFAGKLHTEGGAAALRASLDLNLVGHQNVARAAAEVMLEQGAGGVLLFNASKSAFNPGPDFGPYAVAKAALIALMRQYAIDLGPHRIRANAVNADRIRTDIFGAGVLEARASARGVTVDEYFSANLLQRETLAEDVAQSFVYLATAEATTGCVVTVDGGNASAFPR
jgi:NAD(P)-dependent dehydrogenase (short-subunit alcohol dehydrogenase family)